MPATGYEYDPFQNLTPSLLQHVRFLFEQGVAQQSLNPLFKDGLNRYTPLAVPAYICAAYLYGEPRVAKSGHRAPPFAIPRRPAADALLPASGIARGKRLGAPWGTRRDTPSRRHRN